MRARSSDAALSAKLRCKTWARDLAATTAIRINWILKQQAPTLRSSICTMRCRVWRLVPTRTAAGTMRSRGTLMPKPLKPMVGSAITAVPGMHNRLLLQGAKTLDPTPFSMLLCWDQVELQSERRAFSTELAPTPNPIHLTAVWLLMQQVARVTGPTPNLACESTRS